MLLVCSKKKYLVFTWKLSSALTLLPSQNWLNALLYLFQAKHCWYQHKVFKTYINQDQSLKMYITQSWFTWPHSCLFHSFPPLRYSKTVIFLEVIYAQFRLSATKWEELRELNSQRRHSVFYAVGHWGGLKLLWSHFSPCNDKFYNLTAAGGVCRSKRQLVWEKARWPSHNGKMLIGSGKVSLLFSHNTSTSSYQVAAINHSRVHKGFGKHRGFHKRLQIQLFCHFNISPTMDASETFSKSQSFYMPCVHAKETLPHLLIPALDSHAKPTDLMGTFRSRPCSSSQRLAV